MNRLYKYLKIIFLIFCASTANAAVFDHNSANTKIYNISNNILDQGTYLKKFSNEKKDYFRINYIVFEKLISDEQYTEAREQLETYLKKNKADPNIYNLLGKLDSLENKVAAAKKNFNESLTLERSNLFAHQGLAKIALDEKKLDEAKVSIDKMLSIDEYYYFTYIIESEFFYQKNNLLQAEQSLLTAYSHVQGSIPLQLRVLSILGKFYSMQNTSQKILPLIKELYKDNDENIPIISFYVTNLVVNENSFLAENLLRKIIKLNKKDIPHRVFLAKLLSSSPNNADEVINLFDEAYSLNKKNFNILILKTSFLTTRLKKYEQALKTADLLISIAPDSANGYQLKGDVYKVSKNNHLAIKMYKLALQKDPGITAALSLADLLAKDKQFSKAINLLQRQMSKSNDYSPISFKLASIYEKKSNFSKAEFYYKKTLKIRPNHILTLNNLALLYIQQKKSDALKLATQAYEQAKHSVAIADTYGYAQLLYGDKKIGLEVLKDAAQKAPKILEIHAHLAEAYNLLGHNDKAAQILEKIKKEQSLLQKE